MTDRRVGKLEYIIFGTDRKGGRYPSVTEFADTVQEIYDNYLLAFPEVCHVNIDIAIPYSKEAVNV